jgi:hypothetical protein
MILDNSNQLNLDTTKSFRLIKCFRNYSTQRLDAFTLGRSMIASLDSTQARLGQTSRIGDFPA